MPWERPKKWQKDKKKKKKKEPDIVLPEDAGSILGLAQRVKKLMLPKAAAWVTDVALRLWCRPAAAAVIRPLT